MKPKDLHNRNTEELADILKDSRNALREFRFQVGQGKVKNNKQGRETKKTIARVLTIMKQKKHE